MFFQLKGATLWKQTRVRKFDRSCPFGITTFLGCNEKRTPKFVSIYIISNNHITLSNKKIPSYGRDKNFAAQKSPARRQPGGASVRSADKENSVFSKNRQFATDNIAAGIKRLQTFSIILPNLIHQSKKRNQR